MKGISFLIDVLTSAGGCSAFHYFKANKSWIYWEKPTELLLAVDFYSLLSSLFAQDIVMSELTCQTYLWGHLLFFILNLELFVGLF
jgi:hypothetical protein